MTKELPSKYYLAHAKELFGYLSQHCQHLLNTEHKTYLRAFTALSEDAQCLLVRLLARKHNYVKLASLEYNEIHNLPNAMQELRRHGLISSPKIRDWAELAPLLTKPELLQVLRQADIFFKASSAKAMLVECAMHELESDQVDIELLGCWYVAKRQQTVVEYLFFLFFGDLRNRFQKFAMRDLGVLKVRKASDTQSARFDDKQSAFTAFTLQRLHKQFRHQPDAVFEQAARYAVEPPQSQALQEPARHKLLLELGDHVLASDPDKAIELWRASDEPKALERWVRHAYKYQCKEALQQQLNELRHKDELAAASKLFVEDFHARKYQGKRTSIYTDILRTTQRQVDIDEAFINDVEEGVIAHYAQADVALFTENKLWRVLFAFAFWPILFARQHNEFDRLPAPLKNSDFYQQHAVEIERCLSKMADRVGFTRQCIRLATQHYGYPTGVFRWRSDLMDMVQPCLEYAPENALENTLRRMAKNYRHAKDGYPDIMVVENGHLRFEEIKAPGDVLRPNQLVSIQRLRESGFQVDVTQVNWATNPNQVYAVVDIETTGGRRGGNAITEIAVVHVRDGEIIGEWSSLINPQRAIPRHITQLTGIDNAMVADAPVFSEIAVELREQLRDAIFVAHNVSFDYGFIKAAYENLGQSFRKPKFCTVSNARKAFPGLKSYSLGNLTKAFDIDLKNHHRALADARATAHLLRLIQAANNEQRAQTELQHTA